MIDYTGNGAYCYANSLHMCLEASGAEWLPDPGLLECLTLMPFGCLMLEDGGGQTFLASPSWNDPDSGVRLALEHLGWQCDEIQASSLEAAERSLRRALNDGPVLLGPLDMNGLTYYPRRQGTGAISDHYVVGLASREDRLVLHDPNGYPGVEIAWDEFLAAWGTKLDYGQPFTLRYGFRDAEHLDRKHVVARGLTSLRGRAGREHTRPGVWGGQAALSRTRQLVADGPSASLIGVMVRFSLSGGARRCQDGARFLEEAGVSEGAAAMRDKTYLYGRAQYEAARGNWDALRDCLGLLAQAEELFIRSITR